VQLYHLPGSATSIARNQVMKHNEIFLHVPIVTPFKVLSNVNPANCNVAGSQQMLTHTALPWEQGKFSEERDELPLIQAKLNTITMKELNKLPV